MPFCGVLLLPIPLSSWLAVVFPIYMFFASGSLLPQCLELAVFFCHLVSGFKNPWHRMFFCVCHGFLDALCSEGALQCLRVLLKVPVKPMSLHLRTLVNAPNWFLVSLPCSGELSKPIPM